MDPEGPALARGREPGPPGNHGALPLDPEGLCLQPQDQGRERRAVGARPNVLTVLDKEPPYTRHPRAWGLHTRVDTPVSEGQMTSNLDLSNTVLTECICVFMPPQTVQDWR